MTISVRLLDELSAFIAQRMGLSFPKERRADLERGIIAATAEFGSADPESCIAMLLSSPLSKEQIEILARCLTIGETYFFREEASFKALQGEVLPELICRHREDRQLRIWSAGCATGEEPYSIAMLLSTLLPDLKSWNITLLATDINPRFLEKASRGIYGDWSFRDTPAWVKARWFKPRGAGSFEIDPHLREMVTFSYLNLAEECYPSLLNNTNAMDMILCRNVFMYLTAPMEAKVIGNLSRCLVGDGWLIVSSCEASNALLAAFSPADAPGIPFYRRGSGRARRADKGYFPPEAVSEPAPGPPREVAQSEPSFTPVPFAAAPLPPAPPFEAAATPADPADVFAEANFLYGQGHYAEAESKLQGLLRTAPGTSRAMALLARVYANEGRLSLALGWSEKAVAADKINPENRHLLASIFDEQGRTEDAATALKQAIYLDSDFIIAHFSLGNLLRRLDRIAEAGKYYATAIALLDRKGKDEIVAGSDGLTAGGMLEMIRATFPRS